MLMKKAKLLFSALFILLGVTLSAQNVTVRGTVTDASNGETLPAASVVVRGTTIGVVSDTQGNYVLSAPRDGVLLVSMIGYQTAEVAIGGRSAINVALQPDSEFLDDVIVVAYGTASRAAFTGSATQVKGEDIARVNNESIDKGLIGKVSGVRITSDNGAPGSAANIQIRGVGSVSASTQPLYVIDGVIMDPSTSEVTSGSFSTGILNTINPDDIETMTVLKDAAAASLYGSRASNGVILITTKKGRSGKTTITYTGEVGMSQIANMKAFDIMDGPTFMQWVADSYDGYVQQYGYDSYAAYRGYTGGNTLDLMKNSDWFYKNGDKGNEYFSILYFNEYGKQKLFYPDYILSINKELWIIETKGGETRTGANANIDEFSEKKFNALKEYVAKYGMKGGFVVFDESGVYDQLYITTKMFHKFSDDRSEYKLLQDIFQ